ncbi:transcriptional regulator (plasmid) [Escherichia albertii]|nr:transcriptional regulator [Escherichia albertii]QSZ91702.1 transcriptional regulator [Escherichia albertii]QSZ96098.1 transcriptional regulator [Escherichia albertii]QTA00495.1 transcriptional regulator [Escherichia albertii]QTA04903.1 transcriptional regulator [Escherichia albertii]
MVKDITYGIPAEVWPRDYEHAERTLLFWRSAKFPVRVTLEDGQVFCMYVYGLLSARNKLNLTPDPLSNTNRIRLPLERISTIESGIEEVDTSFTGRLTLNNEQMVNQPSRRDFFKICRQAYQNGKSIRVYMADGREIEGTSDGVDACLVTLKLEDGRKILIFFDWVARILPF